ncbi:efflux RND transporter permease subunit [Rheinheimera texasensis]|uniref:efflux RND transporter permease subunit n=1 Tax=Rheinheimera texasensis TaxID=306205 RepID=UPI0032B17809
MQLGISGRLAAAFKQNQITPLLALVSLLLGLFAVLVTPREEEPQIEVTFANVFIAYPGASAAMVEQQVAVPAEKIIAEIAGVKHVYSVSEPGRSVLTVQFEVGEKRTDALVRLYNAFYAKADWQPAAANIGPVLIKPKGIDDVPVFAVTLWSKNPQLGRAELQAAANLLEEQLQQVPGSRDIYSIGRQAEQVSVRLDPARLSAYQLSLPQLSQALQQAGTVRSSQAMLAPQQLVQLESGSFLTNADEVAQLVVAVRNGAKGELLPVYLRDVADISRGVAEPDTYVQHLQPTGSAGTALSSAAVTVVVAKQPGFNAVDVTAALQDKLTQLQQSYLSRDIELSISRDYGVTAKDKADTLIHKLIFATASVVLLVGLALGKREAIVVGAAVVITLALTLFASWAYGFTLNRVSLFALIFSIGILVDDAIVVVENLHRHWLLGGKPLADAVPLAVEEVGSPTILATFTVIAALLPMAFVSGLMGPYMSPIPLNASMGMLLSLLVAFIFTPWLFLKMFAHRTPAAGAHHTQDEKLEQFFRRLMQPMLRARAGRNNRVKLLVGLLAAIIMSVLLVTSQQVVLKMLPFDNKSEFQVVVDLPEGSTLEQTQAVLNQVSSALLTLPEVTHLQTYAGTAAPMNFNGLVRQYYLRQLPWQGDVQVNLQDRHQRDEQSHAIALRVRPLLSQLEQSTGASIKLVEVPPGPPVLAPLVAEVYGPDYPAQLKAASALQQQFAKTPLLVDIDSTVEAPQPRWQLVADQQKAALLGVSVEAINQTLQMAVAGHTATFVRDEHKRQLTPVELQLGEGVLASWTTLGQLPVVSQTGQLIALSELTRKVETTRENTIYRKDLRPVVFVTADLAGGPDSPLYGMLDVKAALADQQAALPQQLFSVPTNTDQISIKWDGEWQITFETFRDMGIAYGVGLIMIYLLVVAQFKSYGVPLMIMAPIPLTIIGIMPGHWLLGVQFTATSMIGMIALAGIIVRNSILLVDAIQQQTAAGVALDQAVVHASAIRARPIILTALAAMLGAMFILDDPIFGGLAVALIAGLGVSTVLTLVVIPVVYYAYHYQRVAPHS